LSNDTSNDKLKTLHRSNHNADCCSTHTSTCTQTYNQLDLDRYKTTYREKTKPQISTQQGQRHRAPPKPHEY